VEPSRPGAVSRPPPYRALWEITWRCDLRCAHCLVDAGAAEPAGAESTTDEALDTVDQLAALGVRVVSLTGGEPLLRGDWEQIAARVRERGMGLRFSTNGHLASADVVARFVDLGVDLVAVSIDGVRDTHDALRQGPDGRSSYDRVVAAVARLRAAAIPVQAITTVTRANLDELPPIHADLKALGVAQWLVQLAHPTGRARAAAGTRFAPLEPAEVPRVAAFVVAAASDPVLAPAAHNTLGYLGRDEPILRGSGRRGHPVWAGCSCGRTSVGIEPDGGVKGCANQVGAPFVVGSLRNETLRDIWDDAARWRWLSRDPADATGPCAGCALFRRCGGGCSAMAYRTTGSFFGTDRCLRDRERRT
jgi:radical SAM protein with 4Fe4S-binding SPASM domain